MVIKEKRQRIFSRIGIGLIATVILIASLLCLNSLQVFNDVPCGAADMSSHQGSSSVCDSPLNHISIASRALPQSILGLLAFFLVLGALILHFDSVRNFFSKLRVRILAPPRPKRINLSIYRSIFVYLFSRGILHTQVYS